MQVTLVQKQVLRLMAQHGAMVHRTEQWVIGDGLQKLTDGMRESLLQLKLIERVGDELILSDLGRASIPRSPGIEGQPRQNAQDRKDTALLAKFLAGVVRVGGRLTDAGSASYVQWGYHSGPLGVQTMPRKRANQARDLGYLTPEWALTDSGRALAAQHTPDDNSGSTGPQTADTNG